MLDACISNVVNLNMLKTGNEIRTLRKDIDKFIIILMVYN